MTFALSALIYFVSVSGSADAYSTYIETYSDLAVAEQEAHGIPASITLAQGLLESAAGRSTLAVKANNHFGIKCHKDWDGPSMLRDDDAPDECFRAYESAAESFADHSRFLMRKRYASLFELPADDYAGWAHGLRKCGYATDPNYAQRLISIIERYGLYLYDTGSGRQAEEVAGFIFESLRKTHPLQRSSTGLYYVIATPGDTYASIGKELQMDPEILAGYNDAYVSSGISGVDEEIKAWEEVYLEPKRDSYTGKERSATIGEGESMHSLSQRFGIKLSALSALNPKAKDKSGTRLRLK